MLNTYVDKRAESFVTKPPTKNLRNKGKKSEKYCGQRQNGWAGAVRVARSIMVGDNSGQGQVMVGRGGNGNSLKSKV